MGKMVEHPTLTQPNQVSDYQPHSVQGVIFSPSSPILESTDSFLRRQDAFCAAEAAEEEEQEEDVVEEEEGDGEEDVEDEDDEEERPPLFTRMTTEGNYSAPGVKYAYLHPLLCYFGHC